MRKKLWVDNLCPPPDKSWDFARTTKQALEYLKEYTPNIISILHPTFQQSGLKQSKELHEFLWKRYEKMKNDVKEAHLKIPGTTGNNPCVIPGVCKEGTCYLMPCFLLHGIPTRRRILCKREIARKRWYVQACYRDLKKIKESCRVKREGV